MCSIFSTHHYYTSYRQFDIFFFCHYWYIHFGFFFSPRYIHIKHPRSMNSKIFCTYYILYRGYEILSLGLLSLVSFHSWLYYPILRYILGLKTTLRPWYHTLSFDGSHMGDSWDRLVSILIMMVQELWYDPTLGHSPLRKFVGYATTLFDVLHWGIPFSASYRFLRWQFTPRHAHSLKEIRHPLHISVWDDWVISFDMTMSGHTPSLMLIDSWWLYRSIPLLVDDGFWGIIVH